MAQNKPIELICLYSNKLQRFWASFSQKMNAAQRRSIKDSERERGARATGRFGRALKNGSTLVTVPPFGFAPVGTVAVIWV